MGESAPRFLINKFLIRQATCTLRSTVVGYPGQCGGPQNTHRARGRASRWIIYHAIALELNRWIAELREDVFLYTPAFE